MGAGRVPAASGEGLGGKGRQALSQARTIMLNLDRI